MNIMLYGVAAIPDKTGLNVVSHRGREDRQIWEMGGGRKKVGDMGHWSVVRVEVRER